MTTDTIHRYTPADDTEMYVWQDADGELHLLGERHEVESLFQALSQFLDHGILDPCPILEFDPRWGQNYTIAAAVAEALANGYGDDATRTADSIRAAARAGRIRGALVVDGKWSIPKRTLRYWLMQHATQTRGRPRKIEIEGGEK